MARCAKVPGKGVGGGVAWASASRRRRRCLAQWLLGVGVLVAVLGVVLAVAAPLLFRAILASELAIRPDSKSFSMWKETPVPLTLHFYFFNWTNPEDLRKAGSRPILVEMGPYVYREVHEKEEIVWNANATVSFRRTRRWYFDAEASNGSLDDLVTTLDIIAPTAASYVRYWNYLVRKSLSLSVTALGQRIEVTRPVRELLFEGNASPLITLGKTLPALADLHIPVERFAWYYKRNGTNDYDGHFTMHTGVDDLSLLGRISRWNGAEHTSFFSGPCGLVNGSAGELWPPGRTRHEPIKMFSPDLCRSIELPFVEDVSVHGVAGLRFAGGRRMLSNGSENPANACFCGDECAPSGALNVSTCRFGAPAFVSYPHFLHADASYRRAVEGMRPDPERHSFYITVEPETGIPLDAAARFQVNVLLEPYADIKLFEDVPRIFFPMVWFENRASVTPEIARDLRLLLWMRSGLATVALAAAAVGTAFAVTVASVLAYWRYTAPKRKEPKADGAAAPLKAEDFDGGGFTKMATIRESETPLKSHQDVS